MSGYDIKDRGIFIQLQEYSNNEKEIRDNNININIQSIMCKGDTDNNDW